MTITVAPTSGAPSASVTIPFTAVFWANATTLNAERPTASSSLVNGCSSFFIGVRLNGKCLSWISFVRFLAMVRLVQARLCPFGLAKTSNFFRPFLASAIRAGSIALGLTKWFVFNSRFLSMAKLAQARLCPFGLAKTLGCRSNKWVEKRSGRAARPSDQRFMRWFIRRVSFFLKVLGLVVYGRFSASA